MSICVYAVLLSLMQSGHWSVGEPLPPVDIPAGLVAGLGLLMAPSPSVLRETTLGSGALLAPDATNNRDLTLCFPGWLLALWIRGAQLPSLEGGASSSARPSAPPSTDETGGYSEP